MERCAKQVRFSRARVEARRLHELNYFPKEAHISAPFLNYIRYHGMTIDMSRGMNIIDLKKIPGQRSTPLHVK